MKRGRSHQNYGWADVQAELEDGVHPAVVAARLGEPEPYVLEVAEQQGWPVSYKAHPLPSPDEMLARYSSLYGFDS